MGLSYCLASVILIDVEINVGPGEVVGLLGPNGAGKAALFQLLSASCLAQDATYRSMARRCLAYLSGNELDWVLATFRNRLLSCWTSRFRRI